jgi:hypothetical protein
MEFRRAVPVRPLVAEIEGESGLPVAPTLGRDAGGLPAQRSMSVGADRKPCGERVAAPQRDGDARVLDREGLRLVLDEGERFDARARASSAAMRNRFSMLCPKASSPISLAAKWTSGARSSLRVSSMMRMTRIGAACAQQCDQTPSVSSAVTELPRSAVVRLSGGPVGRAISAVSMPALASAIAAVSPTGPPPTIITSTDLPLMRSRSCHDDPGRDSPLRPDFH